MPTINVTCQAARNVETPVFTLPAATEQDVVFTFPAGVDLLELTFAPIPTDVKVATRSVGGGGPADADKTPVPPAGAAKPFVYRFSRRPAEEGLSVTRTLWFFSTTGGKVPGWQR